MLTVLALGIKEVSDDYSGMAKKYVANPFDSENHDAHSGGAVHSNSLCVITV